MQSASALCTRVRARASSAAGKGRAKADSRPIQCHASLRPRRADRLAGHALLAAAPGVLISTACTRSPRAARDTERHTRRRHRQQRPISGPTYLRLKCASYGACERLVFMHFDTDAVKGREVECTCREYERERGRGSCFAPELQRQARRHQFSWSCFPVLVKQPHRWTWEHA